MTARTKRVHNWMYRDGMYVRKLSEAAMDTIDARFATVVLLCFLHIDFLSESCLLLLQWSQTKALAQAEFKVMLEKGEAAVNLSTNRITLPGYTKPHVLLHEPAKQ